MLAGKSFSFYKPEEPYIELEKALPVEVVSTGHEVRVHRDYRWNNQRHLYSHYIVFQHTLSGWGYFEYIRDHRKIRERVGPGKMFIAAWDQPFEYFFDGKEPWDFFWITLSGSFTDEIARTLRDPSPVIEVPMESPPIAFLHDLQERLSGPYRIDRYALTALGYEFLVQLLKVKSCSVLADEERFLVEARSFIKRNIKTASVTDMACHFGYQEKYFIDYFKRRAGTTPNRFIVAQKMRFAASLLMNTRKSVSAVAAELGFSEDNYFSRVFRQNLGLSPSEFRERNRDSIPVDEIIIL
jgi:AraC-like DNA-binding protein